MKPQQQSNNNLFFPTSSSNSNRASLPIDLNRLNRLSPALLNQNRKTRAISIYSRPISSNSSSSINLSSSSSLISSATAISSNNVISKNLDQSSLLSSTINPSSLLTSQSHQLLSQSEVNLACFEHLFSEIIRYTQQRVDGISEFEKKLNVLGYQVGYKLLSLLTLRDSLNGSVNALKSLSTIKSSNSNFGGGSGGGGNDLNNSLPVRLTRLVPVLSWIHTTLWKTIVGKTADILEHSNENEDEYMISDNDLLITRSINVPKEMNQLSCGAYMAGIVEGSLDGLGFPARVTSHFAPSTQFPKRTTLLIKFEKNSIDRENSFKTPTNS
ncbi:NO signaling/Golgi transport ligand-binding domain-containing protein [Phakopsora pachyrhizi]|uniref:NO signaling/Golgi transport ligand-binding domain-containing protein n=1 Tax=Phakopsora pachyrhizi TaxID=170000 RepID=A0AAV0B277_PHAPC|nr:NO signaling/Golgi transport ligand-binding domain-containing protein [Phakopsora pachyrhizi]KAI8449999.1 NO signaling/Golgi transport ligand-binding domain-containing protein [Phakopsora pachyrhizi]CAH7675582.1 NO signaling/Golgi transport ligand-binding domain-containing protein [Phakopsora pachyrhizi]CAH7690188.1 NO signaling/Golgi transport ligand-binding domain-containing protein [Phakopsora pachyrhizi]